MVIPKPVAALPDATRAYRAIVRAAIILFATGALLAAALLVLLSMAQNRAAVEAASRAAHSFLEVRENAIGRVLRDHVRWNDDAYQNLVVAFSPRWTAANFGAEFMQTHDLAYAVVLDGSGSVLFAARDGQVQSGFDARVLGPGLIPLATAARSEAFRAGTPQLSKILVPGEGLHLAGAVAITSRAMPASTAPPVLVITRRINSSTIAQVAADYGFHDLRFAPDGAVPGNVALALQDVAGHRLGTLTFDVDLPGRTLLLQAIPAVLCVHAGMAAILVILLRRARRLMGHLDERNREIGLRNAALEEARDHARAILDSVQDAVLACTADGKVRDANRAAERVFGASAAELGQRRLADLFESPVALPREREKVSLPEAVARRADGTSFEADLVLATASEGGELLHVATVRDRSEVRRAEDTLHALAAPIFILGEHGQALFHNGAASRILGQRDGLAIEGGRLRLGPSEAEFRAALGVVFGGAGGQSVAVQVRRKGGSRPLTGLLSALRQSGPTAPRRAILFLSDPDERRELSPDVLKQVFGLTAAESRVVIELVNGRSPRDMAEAFGTSINTVRNQLKQVFAKTGTGSQRELVSIVLGAAADPSQAARRNLVEPT